MPTGSSPPSGTTVPHSGRVLVVMRHARAESFAEGDHRRRLTDRGRRDAVQSGRWLASAGLQPEAVFVSSAERAQATWRAVAEGAHSEVEAYVDDGLYTAGPDAVMEVLRTAGAAGVVLFVGHNPTAASLAHVLDDGDPDPVAFRSMSEGFPPAAIAVLDVPQPWAELDIASARLVAFHGPRP